MARTTAAAVAALLWLAGPAPAEPAEALRVCLDPDNLPFSGAGAGGRGLYGDLAAMIAGRLGLEIEYVWASTEWGARAIRRTLLAGRCDALVGLPWEKGFLGGRVALTRPFLRVGYAIVAPRGVAVQGLDDVKGRRIGVQFGSPPQLVLAAREGFPAVTFRRAEQALEALARGEVQAAFVWGPTAGYYNKTRLGAAFAVTPVAGPGLQWQVAIGVRKESDRLRERLEGTLELLGDEIHRLMNAYGFPRGAPVPLESRPAGGRSGGNEGPSAAAARTNPLRGAPGMVAEGRTLFNVHCSHCHAPNAENPDRRTDLRRLRLRYGEGMTEVAYTTVHDGRPTRGMPPWKATLSEESIWKILTFLESVQRAP